VNFISAIGHFFLLEIFTSIGSYRQEATNKGVYALYKKIGIDFVT
jgi:hypothetical protein